MGEQKLGTMETRQALALARDNGLDLVEISPNARPPVCKILDYGKFKFEEKKKAKERKAIQVTVETKEMKFRPKTEQHDMEFKCRHIRRFLEEGNRCLLVVLFKGRERAHPQVGLELLNGVVEQMADIGEVIQKPFLEAGKLSVLLAPKSKATTKTAS